MMEKSTENKSKERKVRIVGGSDSTIFGVRHIIIINGASNPIHMVDLDKTHSIAIMEKEDKELKLSKHDKRRFISEIEELISKYYPLKGSGR